MRDYGRVFSSIWESADFRALSEDGRTLVLYLLTCQHGTLVGAFRLPDGYVMEDMQWSSERVSEGFRNLSERGFAVRCETSKWVWVCKYLQWNPLENPNQRKAAVKIAEKVPKDCQWRQRFMSGLAKVAGSEMPEELKPLPNPSATVPKQGTGEGEGEGEGKVSAPVAPAPPAPTPPAPAADAPDKKGCRLPEDWTLPKAWGEWALAKYPHWEADTVRGIGSQFRNHWVAKTGKDATKRDWLATWQNWCDSAITQGQHPPPKAHASKQTSLEARNAAVVAKALEKYAAN